jgi:transposase InsO family protein
MNDRIRTLLLSTIPKTLKLRIIPLRSAAECWKLLKNEFEDIGELLQTAIRKQMDDLRCEENGDPRPILDQLERLVAQYASAGATLDDTEHRSIILRLLPASWRLTVRAILTTTTTRGSDGKKHQLTPTELATQIREIARDDVSLISAPPSSESALLADGSKVCFNCHKPGHIKSQCRAKGGGREGQPFKKSGGDSSSNGSGDGPSKKKERSRGRNRRKGGEGANSVTTDSTYAFAVNVDFSKVDSKALSAKGFTRLLDSGATRHFEPIRNRFHVFRDIPPKPITCADGRTFYATGEGDVPLSLKYKGADVKITLRNVLYAPDMPIGLVSVSAMARANHPAHFEPDGCHILDASRRTIFVVAERNGLYPIVEIPSKLPAPDASMSVLDSSPDVPRSPDDFHRLMGHAYGPALRKMVEKGVIEGITLGDGDFSFCQTCVQGAQKRKPFPSERSSPQSKHYGDRVHSDVWGPAPVASLGGSHYFVTFIDDCTDEVMVIALKKKAGTFSAYRTYESWVKRQRAVGHIGEFQSDRGGEFNSDAFSVHLKEEGTVRRLTVHDSPQQNGVAERLNQTLLNIVRKLLIASGLPRFLWMEALNHAVWVRNRTTTARTEGSTPHEQATGIKPNLADLHEWGSKVWVRVDATSKLDVRSKAGRWVGYDAESKGHRIYWEDRRSVSVERDVLFDVPSTTVLVPIEGESLNGARNQPDSDSLQASKPADPETPAIAPKPDSSISVPKQLAPEDAPSSRPSRVRKPSPWVQRLQSGEGTTGGRGAQEVPASVVGVESANLLFTDAELETALAAALQEAGTAGDDVALAAMPGDEPTVREALNGDDAEAWRKSMQSEIDVLTARGTWDAVERPPGVNVIASLWVLRKKRDQDNEVRKLKSRLVAGGHTQVYGLDYSETASPTIRLPTLRFLLALRARYNLNMTIFDFSNAYLNGDLEEEIYMRQPPGFEIPGSEHLVLRLKKALYGLKQAGRQWYKTLRALMMDLDFTCSAADPALFYIVDEEFILMIGVHVDDCMMLGTSNDAMRECLKKIEARYPLVETGDRWALGFELAHDRIAGTVTMSQSAYIDTLAARFNLTAANPLSIPLDPHTNLFNASVSEDEREVMRTKPYARLIGSLMYAAVATRPDIAYAVSTLARFMSDPAMVHWEAAKRVLRYLIGTKSLALTFGLDRSGFVAYSDSDWASQPHRHSISGAAYLYDGAAIAWSSRKQSIIALSSTEAEYIAASNAAREIVWFDHLASELDHQFSLPVDLRMDNQGAIALAQNGLMNARNKHIDIHYHFIRDSIDNNLISLQYTPTNDMVADALTKALPRAKLEYFRHLMGLR